MHHLVPTQIPNSFSTEGNIFGNNVPCYVYVASVFFQVIIKPGKLETKSKWGEIPGRVRDNFRARKWNDEQIMCINRYA
jgi:hypothetical protein